MPCLATAAPAPAPLNMCFHTPLHRVTRRAPHHDRLSVLRLLLTERP